jgi:hypothetical protein
MHLMYQAVVFIITVVATVPSNLSDQKQLFIDRELVEASSHIASRVNPAQKLGPKLDKRGKPIECFVSRVVDGQRMARLYLGADGVEVLESKDGLHFVRTGVNISYDSVILRPEYGQSAQQLGGVGIVRQRVDGFVSLNADDEGGWLRTKPVSFQGNRLRLNIDTGAMGSATVEQGAQGK